MYVATDSTAQVEIRDLRFESRSTPRAAGGPARQRGGRGRRDRRGGAPARPRGRGPAAPAADYVLVVSEPLRALAGERGRRRAQARPVRRVGAHHRGPGRRARGPWFQPPRATHGGGGAPGRRRRLLAALRARLPGRKLAQLAPRARRHAGPARPARRDRAQALHRHRASHELRTPIFSLGGFLELLEDEDLDPDTRVRFTGQLREQVDRLGKLDGPARPVAPGGRLARAAPRADRRQPARRGRRRRVPAGARRARLAPRGAGGRRAAGGHLRPRAGRPDHPYPGRQRAGHTPAGTDVVIAASRRDERRLAVTDFGTGIKRGAMDHIFEPFHTSDDAQGSGLGLAIAHELAERMRSELTVESMPGRTTFALEFPGMTRAAATAPVRAVRRSRWAPAGATRPRATTARLRRAPTPARRAPSSAARAWKWSRRAAKPRASTRRASTAARAPAWSRSSAPACRARARTGLGAGLGLRHQR